MGSGERTRGWEAGAEWEADAGWTADVEWRVDAGVDGGCGLVGIASNALSSRADTVGAGAGWRIGLR